MKIKAISRSVSAIQPPGTDAVKQPRNLDSAVHPFERAREYKRALNAVKLERMHAAPFIAQLGRGHVDGVYSIAKDPNSLERFSSGSGDGVVKVWDLASREEVWQASAHENIVKGLDSSTRTTRPAGRRPSRRGSARAPSPACRTTARATPSPPRRA
ncbi:hypothetical protein TgHK011_003705 [Trichoderma gracile]|nr:hypothetical protein TgHK011_003705 [Trichoderma gracile]